MSNKSRKQTPGSATADAMKRFNAALQKVAENTKNQQAQQESEVEADEETGAVSGEISLDKPARQAIFPNYIEWTWNAGEVNFVSVYYTEDTAMGKAGTYAVDITGDLDNLIDVLTPTEARQLGQALLSAALWENVWQQHVGEYLAVPSSTAPAMGGVSVVEDENVPVGHPQPVLTDDVDCSCGNPNNPDFIHRVAGPCSSISDRKQS
jgi:hypothetical protein